MVIGRLFSVLMFVGMFIFLIRCGVVMMGSFMLVVLCVMKWLLCMNLILILMLIFLLIVLLMWLDRCIFSVMLGWCVVMCFSVGSIVLVFKLCGVVMWIVLDREVCWLELGVCYRFLNCFNVGCIWFSSFLLKVVMCIWCVFWWNNILL